MDNPNWPALGLTDSVITELYRRGRDYAERRIGPAHRDDAVQDGMCEVLKVVANPPVNYPTDPTERLDYLTKALYNSAMKRITRKTPPDTTPIEE